MSSVAARVLHMLIAFSCLFIASSTSDTGMHDSLSLCFPVMECDNEGPDININRLNYELLTDSWDGNENMICPRSDPDIPQWQVLFKNNSDAEPELTSGSYCLRNTTTDNSSFPLDLSPSVICTKNGKLIIQTESNYEGTSGQLEFKFNSSTEYSYVTNLTIRYAPTGVYAEHSTVYFTEGDSFKDLNWFIYHPNPSPNINTFKVYFNGRLIKNESTEFDKTKYSQSLANKCIGTTTADQTLYYSLFVINPSATLSTGEYVLVINEYSATITLALNPSPPAVTTTTTSPLPSSSLHGSSVLSSLLSSPVIGSDRPPGPSTLPTVSLTSTSSSITGSSTSNRLYPSSSPTIRIRTDPTSRSSSSFNRGTTIILPVTLGVFVLLAIIAVLFCVVAFIKYKRRNKTSNDTENVQGTGRGVDGGESSSSMAFTSSSDDPTPINIHRQYSEDPSLHKYHLRSGKGSNRKDSHEAIGLENFTLSNDQSLKPTATTTTSFNGPFSRSLSKNSNQSYHMIEPVNDDITPPLKSATSVARTDSSDSLEYEDHVNPMYVNASRSSSLASNELIDNQQPIGASLQHKRLAELKGGATIVSQSLPTATSLLTAAVPHNDTTQTQLMSSSVSSLALEKEKTHLLGQFFKQAKKKVKMDKQIAIETDRTSREQLAIKKEMVNILQKKEGEEGVTDGHVGFYNQMSEVVDDGDDPVFVMDQD